VAPVGGSVAPEAGELAPVAITGLLVIAGVMMLALCVTSGRYGYHRDELYFVSAGAHPAWGYPDQPLMAPLLARAADLLAHGSLLVLRAPSTIACGATTVVTGLLAREAGGARRAQLLAAACWAVSLTCLAAGHIVATATYDICFTAIVSLLIARLLRTGDDHLWLAAGAVVGIGFLNKTLIGVVVAVVLISIAAVGPREVLRSRWLIAGAGLAILGALPYGIWQLTHGLPQLALARSIAQSGTEGGRGGFIPFQLFLIGPLLAPVWIAGLVALIRNRRFQTLRAFAVAYFVLIPVFIVTGGKAYYIAGLYPVLVGVGAVVTNAWLDRRAGVRRTIRAGLVVVAIGLTGALSAVIGLDLLPVRDLQGSSVFKINPDSGETVGWPRFTDTVAGVFREVPTAQRSHTAIFTSNYGEAGAIAMFGPRLGLPYPHSGHNGWWWWGPPPNIDKTVVVVGLDRARVNVHFTGCRLGGRINDGVGLNNQEQGSPVWLCTNEVKPWSQIWRSLRQYD